MRKLIPLLFSITCLLLTFTSCRKQEDNNPNTVDTINTVSPPSGTSIMPKLGSIMTQILPGVTAKSATTVWAGQTGATIYVDTAQALNYIYVVVDANTYRLQKGDSLPLLAQKYSLVWVARDTFNQRCTMFPFTSFTGYNGLQNEFGDSVYQSATIKYTMTPPPPPTGPVLLPEAMITIK